MSIRAADETTEVLLADYLDGNLAPERQREIDLYLASHPKEKVVIEQLLAQRQLLSALSRERAPDEVSEAVQSQLERSVLLESLAEIQGPSTGAVRSRPQRLALAACVLASAGLIGVVYLMTVGPPARFGGGTEVATTLDPQGRTVPRAQSPSGREYGGTVTTQGSSGSLRNRERPREGEPGSGETVTNADLGTDVPRPGAPGAVALSAGAPGSGSAARGESLARPNVSAAGDQEVAKPVADASDITPSTPARRIVITATDLPHTRSKLEAFLRAGGWSYLAAPRQSPANIASPPDGVAAPGEPENLRHPEPPAPTATRPTPDDGPGTGIGTGGAGDTVLLLVRVEADQVEALSAALSRLGQMRESPEVVGAGTMGLAQRAAASPTSSPTASPSSGGGLGETADPSSPTTRQTLPGSAHASPPSPAESGSANAGGADPLVDGKNPAPRKTMEPLQMVNLVVELRRSVPEAGPTEGSSSRQAVTTTRPSTQPATPADPTTRP